MPGFARSVTALLVALTLWAPVGAATASTDPVAVSLTGVTVTPQTVDVRDGEVTVDVSMTTANGAYASAVVATSPSGAQFEPGELVSRTQSGTETTTTMRLWFMSGMALGDWNLEVTLSDRSSSLTAADLAAAGFPSTIKVTRSPVLPPDAPAQVRATAGNGQADVVWEPPGNTNGAPVSRYTVTASPSGLFWQVSGDTTGITARGLTNGTTYTFTVSATNSAGTSPESAPSSPVTPKAPPTVPDAPTGVTATPGDRQATVAWTAPADGGDPINWYRITPTPLVWQPRAPEPILVAGEQTSGTVTGLQNGVAYTFTVAAFNDLGYGPASAATSVVTPAAAPDAPTSVWASPSDRAAFVNWTDGPTNGAAITEYVVTTHPDGGTRRFAAADVHGTGPGHWVAIEDLVNGTDCWFTVTAVNDRGTSPDSAPSTTVTPDTAPTPPTDVTATRRDQAATVTWLAPAPNGGTALTGYRVVAYPSLAETTVSADQQSVTMTGLTNGARYTFEVFALSAAGSSPASAQSNPVVPAGTPLRMARPAVRQTGGQQATVRWQAPFANGDRIRYYRVIPDKGAAKQVAAWARKVTFRGLKTRRYEFRVVAVNTVGASPRSLPGVLRIR